MVRASIIVVAWNGEAYLERCLGALVSQVEPDDEIIVVDNGSTDGSVALVRRRYPQVRLIENGRNLGFAGGVNVGVQAAMGGVFVSVNQDVQVGNGWLSALLDTFNETSVGIVGCKLFYPDGKLQHAGGIIRWPQAFPDHYGYRQPDDGAFDQVRQVDYVTGAAWGFRRAVVEQIGLLDEGFWPGYYEEVDYCFRARRAGWQIVYQPRATGTHYESTSLTQASTAYLEAFHRGRLRFLFKWQKPEALQESFVPAEGAWLPTVSPIERNSVRQAYRATLRAITELIGDRAASLQATQVLESLYMNATASQSNAAHELPGVQELDLSDRLEALQTLQEHTFRSDAPLIGPLIAWFRDVWNSISTKWYVRPVMHQQSQFNGLLLEALRLQQRQIAELHQIINELDGRLIGVDLDETAAVRTVAELTTRIIQLDQSLVELEAQLAPGKDTTS